MGQVAEQIIGLPANVIAEEEDPDSDDLPQKIRAILHKRYLFTVNINAHPFQKSDTNFTVKRVEPVPASVPNFTAMPPGISHSAYLISPETSPTGTHHTTLTPQTKSLNIATSSQSGIGSSSTTNDTTSSPRPKRKLDFEDETYFLILDDPKEKHSA